jgi:hypothetical protein
VAVSEQHEMIFSGRAESGAEEWSCPSCGRRELLRWPPNHERVVLEEGDVTAMHFGAKGGVWVSSITTRHALAGDITPDERQWLRSNGIDWGR